MVDSEGRWNLWRLDSGSGRFERVGERILLGGVRLVNVPVVRRLPRKQLLSFNYFL